VIVSSIVTTATCPSGPVAAPIAGGTTTAPRRIAITARTA
jgi:hypothetical protein